MRNKILVTALLVVVLCISCNGEGASWLKERIENTDPVNPNVHSQYFQLTTEEGTIEPKDV